MANMPRPRRKREKKLMSMDEVNERFPLTRYKVWRASREESGLPAAGGITAAPSRAASIREQSDVKRASTDAGRTVDAEELSRSSKERTSTQRPETGQDGAGDEPKTSTAKESIDVKAPEVPADKQDIVTFDAQTAPHRHSNDLSKVDPETPAAEDEEDPIDAAGLPAELANVPGDQCAICIETLEDDDEVRGLTCGHAYHAGCLDPWLTSRRACCPLCKADYYVPKPRSDGTRGNNDSLTNGPLPQPPEQAHRRFNVGGTNYLLSHHDRYGFPVLVRDRTDGESTAANASNSQNGSQNGTDEHGRRRTMPLIRPSLPMPRLPALPRFGRNSNRRSENGNEEQATPGQLEAGTR